MNNKIFSTDLNNKLVNQNVNIIGWIHSKVKIGNFVFIKLRDSFGFCQLVISKEKLNSNNNNFNLNKENLINVKGIVKTKKTINKNQNAGFNNYEIWVNEIFIINKSLTLPFMIEDNTDGLEKIRLQYRYLDLRRPIMQKNMWMRHDILKAIRMFFYEKKGFIELETPILSTPTIEGAKNFLIVADNNKTNFALPQSPQIYKQMLMNAGFYGYFQIARCFRDEDLRNNRQPEFSQLDLEVNFANTQEIMNYIENLIVLLWKKFKLLDVKLNFIKLDYEKSWNKYGTENPDLRYEMFLEDFSSIIKIENNNNCKQILKGICFNENLPFSQWKILQQEIKKITNQNLSFLFVKEKENNSNLTFEQLQKLKTILQKKEKKNWIGFYGCKKEVNLILGKVRIFLADVFELTINKPDHFCWIINQPMFEFSKTENKYVSTHHPFCQPKDLDVFHKDWKISQGDSFDLVINGEEIGSGSVRIHDLKIQKKVFSILGFDEKKMQSEFGFFLKAMEYGFPHHAGFALGIERLLTWFTNYNNSIRDVIPFPKTTKGTCLLTKKPKK